MAGALLAPLKWVAATLLTLLGLLLGAWIVDWVLVFHVWPEGLGRLEAILQQDLQRAAELSKWCTPCHGLAQGTANLLYALLFKLTGIHDMGLRFADPSTLSIPDTITRNAYIRNFEAIQVAMLGTQVFGVRGAMAVMALPLLALAYSIAMADGLVQRGIRRASGGRESASLYHRGKHLQVILVALGVSVVLVQPVAVDPRWTWVPLAVTLGLLARTQWVYYKKHL